MGLLILIIILLICAALYPQQKLEKPSWMDQNERLPLSRQRRDLAASSFAGETPEG
jgi:hypothetical protein